MTHLLFDADGTLYDFKASEDYALRKVFQNHSIPYTAENYGLYQIGNRDCWNKYENGLMKMSDLRSRRFSLFFEALGLDADGKEAGDDYTEYLGETGFLIPGAEEFIRKIYQLDPIYIVTNGIPSTQHRRIENSGMEGFFRKIYISDEIGVAKPDRRFFDHVLSDIGCSADEAIVIGDSEKSDILGARNAGIRSIFISFSGAVSKLADWSVSSYEELGRLLFDGDQLDIEDQQ